MVVFDITEVTFMHVCLNFKGIGVIGRRMAVLQRSALEKIVEIQQIVCDPGIAHADGLLHMNPFMINECSAEDRPLFSLPLFEIPPVY